jgi:hypothetical protein
VARTIKVVRLEQAPRCPEPRPVYHKEVSMEALLIPAITPPAAAELFVAAVLGWIGLNIHRTVRDPRTPPATVVLLDLSLGLVTVTALVFFFSASLKVFF